MRRTLVSPKSNRHDHSNQMTSNRSRTWQKKVLAVLLTANHYSFRNKKNETRDISLHSDFVTQTGFIAIGP